jgi:UDP-N-acetylglucosamine 1-carboxyvinyltransferase
VLFHDWMYPSRMFFLDKLVAMGAQIVLCDPHRCIVQGPTLLYGENMESPDIRAGMSLVLAALAAEGRSVIRNVRQIDRGYEKVDEKLRQLGARIERAREE